MAQFAIRETTVCSFSRPAQAIDVPYERVNKLVNQKKGITSSTALRLSKFFGNSPNFWLNLQNAWEIYHAQAAEAEQLEKIQPWAIATQ